MLTSLSSAVQFAFFPKVHLLPLLLLIELCASARCQPALAKSKRTSSNSALSRLILYFMYHVLHLELHRKLNTRTDTQPFLSVRLSGFLPVQIYWVLIVLL